MISRINTTTSFKAGWQKNAQKAGLDSANRLQELRTAARATNAATAKRAAALGADQVELQQTRAVKPQS